jgi:hypothetical protein
VGVDGHMITTGQARLVYRRIARADSRADQSTHGGLEVVNLVKLSCGPVMEKLRSLEDKLWNATRSARVHLIMESMGIEPVAVCSTSEAVTFICCQGPPISEIRIPLVERIYVFPTLGNTPDHDDLPQKGIGVRRISNQMRRLTVVEGEELKDIA